MIYHPPDLTGVRQLHGAALAKKGWAVDPLLGMLLIVTGWTYFSQCLKHLNVTARCGRVKHTVFPVLQAKSRLNSGTMMSPTYYSAGHLCNNVL